MIATTSTMVITKVSSTSLTEARIVWVRSARIATSIAEGIVDWRWGRAAFT